MKKIIIALSLLLNISLVFSQDLGDSFESATSLRNPYNLRDPFKIPKVQKRREKRENKLLDKGILDNSPRTDLLRLDSIVLKGIIWNGIDKRAIFGSGRGGGSAVYVLTEGAVISNGQVTLKAILPKSVIFVEKITNVYGQPEYLETVVPISG